MASRELYLFLFFIGCVFILSSCDQQVTQPEQEQSEELFSIPHSGNTALPKMAEDVLPAKNLSVSSKRLWSGYETLKQYAKNHPKHPYAAIVGQWNTEEKHYDYKAMKLHLPPKMQQKADGKVGYFKYQLTDSTGKIYRIMAALIPPSRPALKKMYKWLKFKDRTKVAGIKVYPMASAARNDSSQIMTRTSSVDVGDVVSYMQEPGYQTCGDLTTEGCVMDEGVITGGSNDSGWYVKHSCVARRWWDEREWWLFRRQWRSWWHFG